MGGPVVLKVVSPVIPHKTDAHGVELNLLGAEQARPAFQRVIEAGSRFAIDQGLAPDIRGVLVTKMLPSPVAELFVGVRHDPDYGPVLSVGAGGVAVEIHHDTALRGLPIGRVEAMEMLDEIRIARLLNGFRGRPPANREALADVILGIAACALTHHEIEELEANPVFAYEDRAVVVDVRCFLRAMPKAPTAMKAAPTEQQVAS
jgi:acyl-CoA synthetase (NDP forming)